MQVPIITLTTDWGTKDFYVGMYKGHLLSALPEARIIDITHEIEDFDVFCGAQIVRHACPAFPQGTIHIVDVDSSSVNAAIVALCDGQYYVCADNGLLYHAFNKFCDKVVRVEYTPEQMGTFVAVSVLLPLALRLAKGEAIENLGSVAVEKGGTNKVTYRLTDNGLSIMVTHVDSYGNATLGITREEFESIRAGRPFKINMMEDCLPLSQISPSYYCDSDKSNLLLLETSTGYLQIAVIHASAQQLLGLKSQSAVMVTFVGKTQ